MLRSIYLIGSLSNPEVPLLANKLRALGFEVFDDWHSPGPETDVFWQKYEQGRGHNFIEALNGYHAWHVFGFDKEHLDSADIGVLLMPAGKSGHLELGYLIGQGKPGFILLTEEPARWDIMYRFCSGVFLCEDDLFLALQVQAHQKRIADATD